MRRLSNQFSPLVIVAGLAVALILNGCQSQGPERYEISGKVTYEGQPVSAGLITFEPEGIIINATTIGEAEIEDGEYKTLPAKGVVGGPHTVFIAGYNGIPEPGSGPYGASLFAPVFKTSIELPREPSTHDFHVPKSGK